MFIFQDYDAFNEAIEDNRVDEFLKIATETEKSTAQMTVTGVSKMFLIACNHFQNLMDNFGG